MQPASITISPTSQDFGMPPAFGKSTRTFVVTNTGGSPTGLPVPAISGPDAASFSIGANACTILLAPGTSCSIYVDLPFSNPTPGQKTATLSVTAMPGGVASAGMAGNIQI